MSELLTEEVVATPGRLHSVPLTLGAALLAAATTALWGTNPTALKIALHDFPPLGAAGARSLPVAQLILRPNRTRIRSGELLTHFTVEAPPDGAKTAFIKVGRRNAQAISRLTMAAMGRVGADGRVDFARITPGAATPQTIRFTAAEAMLVGQPVSEELISAASRRVAEMMIAITGRRWSTEYKERAIVALAERALQAVLTENPA